MLDSDESDPKDGIVGFEAAGLESRAAVVCLALGEEGEMSSSSAKFSGKFKALNTSAKSS